MPLREVEGTWSFVHFDAFFIQFVSFFTRGSGKEPKEQYCEDLERLALSAPHLLADIGFEPDLRSSSPVKTIWRKGATSVALSSGKVSVSVFR